VGACGPLHGSRYPILKSISPVGESRSVSGSEPEKEAVEHTTERTHYQYATGEPQAPRTQNLSQHQRNQSREGSDQEPAETVVLRPAQTDLPHHVRNQSFQDCRIRHRRPQSHDRSCIGHSTWSATAPRPTSYLRKSSFCDPLMLCAESISSPMSRSTSTPSASPSKFRMRRWRRAGRATARRSSTLTL